MRHDYRFALENARKYAGQNTEKIPALGQQLMKHLFVCEVKLHSENTPAGEFEKFTRVRALVTKKLVALVELHDTFEAIDITHILYGFDLCDHDWAHVNITRIEDNIAIRDDAQRQRRMRALGAHARCGCVVGEGVRAEGVVIIRCRRGADVGAGRSVCGAAVNARRGADQWQRPPQ